jgi:hypothetical protein
MIVEDLQRAVSYVDSVDLTGIPRPIIEQDASVEASGVFDKAKDQAQVIGSGVFSFAKGVDEDVRAAISDSALLAQLVADKRASSTTDPLPWFAAYADVLKNLGWVLQDSNFQDYTAKGTAVDIHDKVIEVLAAALGPAPAAAAIILATMNALKGMDPKSSWIRIFSREAQHAKIARFQIGLVETGATNDVFVSMLACLITANDTITQVLFFKWRQSNAKFEANANKVSINRNALAALHPQILAKTRDFQNAFLSSIQDLQPAAAGSE